MSDLPPDTLPTVFYERHLALGGRMVPFAGHALPVQYKGLIAEHAWTRESASLFDVSHMGQIRVRGRDHSAVAAWLERLTPADLASLAPGEMRYTVLLNARGGIEDDLIVTRPSGEDGTLDIVVNAARRLDDLEIMRAAADDDLDIVLQSDRALLALQGPKAAEVLARHSDLPERLGFMQSGRATIAGVEVLVSRSGYTGEDGFELSMSEAGAGSIFDLLLDDPRVAPAGLGARDSLRLEAGLCLYGHDMDADTDPVTAGLVFAIGKHRREAGGFVGAGRVLDVLRHGPKRRRVGLRFSGRQPVREGASLQTARGEVIGHVTSGSFSPTLQMPVAMGYVAAEYAAPGTPVRAIVRDRPIEGEVAPLPFVPHRYVRTPRL